MKQKAWSYQATRFSKAVSGFDLLERSMKLFVYIHFLWSPKKFKKDVRKSAYISDIMLANVVASSWWQVASNSPKSSSRLSWSCTTSVHMTLSAKVFKTSAMSPLNMFSCKQRRLTLERQLTCEVLQTTIFHNEGLRFLWLWSCVVKGDEWARTLFPAT